MINAVVEDWFDDVMGSGFNQLVESGRGVSIETQFYVPRRSGWSTKPGGFIVGAYEEFVLECFFNP